jgi:hypothetical protein
MSIKTPTHEERFSKARISTTAANTLVAQHYDDIIDNLDGMQVPQVTPYELLLALNQSGLLNSFLYETHGSAEILLSGLMKLYDNLGNEKKPNMHNHVDVGGLDYAEGCIKAADFIKHAYSEVNTISSKHPTLKAQEEDLSPTMKAEMSKMADDLVCETITDRLQQREATLISTAKNLTEHKDDASPATQQRRFLNRAIDNKMAAILGKTDHYRSDNLVGQLFSSYMISLVENKLSTHLDNADIKAFTAAKEALGKLYADFSKAASLNGFSSPAL